MTGVKTETDCYTLYGTQTAEVDKLETYLNSIYPQELKDMYDLSVDNVYVTVHLKYLFHKPDEYGMDILSWYGDGERTVEIVYDSYPVIAYKVQERVRRGIIDLILVVDDHDGADIMKEYISKMEGQMDRKALKVVFTLCGPAHRLKIHKDFSGIYDNKLHLVITNGGISSLVWYDDNFHEVGRFDGQRGDLFFFDGQKYYHKFDKPKSDRIHMIMCFDDDR